MNWQRHDLREHPRYHLDCKIKNRKHIFSVSVVEIEKGLFDLYMPARSAGSPLLLKKKTRDQLNVFLGELKLPNLPAIES